MAGADDPDPDAQVSAIYDDRHRLEDRTMRLRHGPIHARDPKSRMRRVISNIEIEAGPGGEIITHSNFLLAELRRGQQDIFAGRAIHKLRPDGDSFKIALKKVLLLTNDGPIDNLTFLKGSAIGAAGRVSQGKGERLTNLRACASSTRPRLI